jgi:hypothetical protein
MISALASALLPALSWAGGGGSKPTSTIIIKNVSGELLAVIVNPPANLNVNNLDSFRAQGGKTLNAGESTHFKVKAGLNPVSAAYINVAAGAPGAVRNQDFSVGKNRTVKVDVSGSSAAAPNFTVK